MMWMVYAGIMQSKTERDWTELRDCVVALYQNPRFGELTVRDMQFAIMEDRPPISPWYAKRIARELSLETLAWSLDRTGCVPKPWNQALERRVTTTTRPYTIKKKNRDHWRIMRAALALRFATERYDSLTDEQLSLAVVDDDADRHGFAEPQLIALHLSVPSLERRRTGDLRAPSNMNGDVVSNPHAEKGKRT